MLIEICHASMRKRVAEAKQNITRRSALGVPVSLCGVETVEERRHTAVREIEVRFIDKPPKNIDLAPEDINPPSANSGGRDNGCG